MFKMCSVQDEYRVNQTWTFCNKNCIPRKGLTDYLHSVEPCLFCLFCFAFVLLALFFLFLY